MIHVNSICTSPEEVELLFSNIVKIGFLKHIDIDIDTPLKMHSAQCRHGFSNFNHAHDFEAAILNCWLMTTQDFLLGKS